MLKAAKEAGKVILRHYGNYGKLKFKNPRSLLTKVDLQTLARATNKTLPIFIML